MMKRVSAMTIETLEEDMVFVEGGMFLMGGEDWESDSQPVHRVRLNDFEICRYPVTQALWQAVMGENPSEFLHPQRPVESVSWADCQAFIAELNQMTGQTYRLPTEAQWEYAARGGKYNQDLTYAGSKNLYEVGWFNQNSQNISQPVGRKRPNALGLYDLSGNAREWCQDGFDAQYYATCATAEVTLNPEGPSKRASRVIRGGSWLDDDDNCRVAARFDDFPNDRFNDLSLRIARY